MEKDSLPNVRNFIYSLQLIMKIIAAYFENDQTVLKEIYEDFGISTNGAEGVFPKETNGSLINPSFGSIAERYDLPIPENFTKLCQKDRSLMSVYKEALASRNLPSNLINIWSVLQLQRAFLPYSAYQGLYDTPELSIE